MWNTKKEDFPSSTVLELQTQTNFAIGETEEDLSTELLGTTTLTQLRGETGLERYEERNLQTEFSVITLELQLTRQLQVVSLSTQQEEEASLPSRPLPHCHTPSLLLPPHHLPSGPPVAGTNSSTHWTGKKQSFSARHQRPEL